MWREGVAEEMPYMKTGAMGFEAQRWRMPIGHMGCT